MASLLDISRRDEVELEKKKRQLSGVDWEDLLVLSSRLQCVEEFVTNTGLCDRAGAEFNRLLHRGLCKAVAALRHRIKVAPSELKPLEHNLSDLKGQKKLLMSEETCALKNMASAQLRRVGAPDEAVRAVSSGVVSSNELMGIVASGAGAEAFNSLLQALMEKDPSLPEWTCSVAASKRPEADLLGMCPGGRPHLSEEQLQVLKVSRCHCLVCEFKMKQLEIAKNIAQLQQEVEELHSEIRECHSNRRVARKCLQRFRALVAENSLEAEEVINDPVFSKERPLQDDDDHALETHRLAQEQWERLEQTLTTADLPLRLIFLDKSGSMGSDAITHAALLLAVHNSLHPTHGSTLTILFAAPGETQIVLRRPSDAPLQFNVCLGSATWFNEPICRTLNSLAPLVETLDMQSFVRDFGEPPLQVLCLTDGFDNCSAHDVRSLTGLVREVKQIKGPATQKKVYLPIVGSVKSYLASLEKESSQVPVWLVWIASGVGGTMLLDSKLPKELCLIDAVAAPMILDAPPDIPQQSMCSTPALERDNTRQPSSVDRSTAVSRARCRVPATSVQIGDAVSSRRRAPSAWNVGHRVQVKAQTPGRAPKAAVVLRAVLDEHPTQYEVLFDDETTRIVEDSELIGSAGRPKTLLYVRPTASSSRSQHAQQGFLSRTSEPNMQRLQVLALVNSMTQDMSAVVHSMDSKSNRLSLEMAVSVIEGGEEVQGEAAASLEAKVKSAQSALNVVAQPQLTQADPAEVLLEVLLVAGSSAANLLPEDRVVAQRYLSAALEILVAGGSVLPQHVGHQLATVVGVIEANSVRRISLEGEQLEKWQSRLTLPTISVLGAMSKRGLLELTCTANGDALLAGDDAKVCVAAIWRFFDPSLQRSSLEDSLRRAVNRFQRLQPAFSFCYGRSTSKETVLSRSSISTCSSSTVEESCLNSHA